MGKLVAYTVLGILGVMALFAVVASVLIGGGGSSRRSNLSGGELSLPTGPVTIPSGIEQRSCKDIRTVLPNIPEEYVPFITEAADRWLGGDQAKIIAVAHFESGFNRVSISDTGAVGIGQFIASTARTKVSYQGSTIYNVSPRSGPNNTLTNSDKETFRNGNSDDGRFDARRSTNAVAELLNYNLKQAAKDGHEGDFRWAYAKYYNGEPGDKKFHNADKMLAVYQLILSKDCKA